MSDAERLRSAATRLRETAVAATPGEWQVCDFNEGCARPLWAVTNDAFLNPPVDEEAPWLAVEVHTGTESDARHIALMSPPVALALADWLDDTAGRWLDSDGKAIYRDTHLGDVIGFEESGDTPALAVADAVLGGDQS